MSTQSMPSSPEPDHHANGPSKPDFETECRSALIELRQVLIEAFGQAGADASRPRQAARQLNLDKNIVWRVSRIVGQSDVFAAVGDVPRRSGRNILEAALRQAGVAAPTLVRLRTALDDFDRLVERHAGDRATFELVAGSFGQTRRQQSQEQARRLAFRGNSAVWSVQVETQIALTLIAPNAADPSMVDVAQITGLVNLRRLRQDVRWLLGRGQVWQGDDVRATVGEPIDGTPGDVPLLRAFCSDPMPDLVVEEVGDERRYMLAEGPVGRTGEATCVFGSVVRALGSQFADAPGALSQFGANLLTPAEHLQFDLFVHPDLDWALDPQAAVFGTLDGRPVHVESGRQHQRLPIHDPVFALGHGTAGTSTPRMPWYPDLAAWCFEHLGWDGDAFHGFRYELAHPPMPAHALLYAPLRPATGSAPDSPTGSSR